MEITWKKMAVTTIVITALLALSVQYVYGLPTEKETTRTLYTTEQASEGAYMTYLEPNTLYGETIEENETIYLSIARKAEVDLKYYFSSSESGDVSMVYSTDSQLKTLGTSGWGKNVDDIVSVNEKSIKIDNNSATLNLGLSYDFQEILGHIERIQENIEYEGFSHEVTTTVTINAVENTAEHGVIDSGPVEKTVTLSIVRDRMYGTETSNGTASVSISNIDISNAKTEMRTEKTGNSDTVGYLQMGSGLALLAWVPLGAVFTGKRYKSENKKLRDFPRAERILKTYDIVEAENIPSLPIQKVSTMKDLRDVAEDYGSRIF
ncbi:MAG: hypothetical protein ACLFUR_05960, partial [Candidatus Hadarchaeia archaeon]